VPGFAMLCARAAAPDRATASSTPSDIVERNVRSNMASIPEGICGRIAGGFLQEVDGLIDHPADNANAAALDCRPESVHDVSEHRSTMSPV
jgi:hypothetical protein